MEITDVKINLTPDQPPLEAFASITFDNCFVVHNLRVIKTADKIFVAMPSKKIKNGNRADGNFYKDIAHPINPEMRTLIEEAILSHYGEAVKNMK